MCDYLVAIKATILPGLFDSERQFMVILANGNEYWGICPTHFTWDGLIAAKAKCYCDDNTVILEVPTCDHICVDKDNVVTRPNEVQPIRRANALV